MNVKKLEPYVNFGMPSLGKEALILVNFFLLIIRELGEESNLLRQENKTSNPPSQDTKRPMKRRSEEGGAKRLAASQNGHKGQGGKFKGNPDYIVPRMGHCLVDGRDLRQFEVEAIVQRQIEDILPIKTGVTEYEIEVRSSLGCAVCWYADGCEQPYKFEYGPRVKALAVYLSTFQFLPLLLQVSKQVAALAEFTNKRAVWDLPMNTVSAKLSGGFRELKLAKEYMRILALSSTMVKQAFCPLQTLEQVFTKGDLKYMNLVHPDYLRI